MNLPKHSRFSPLATVNPQHARITLVFAGVHNPLQRVAGVIIGLIEVGEIVEFEGIVDGLIDCPYFHVLLRDGLHEVGEEDAEDGREYLAEIGALLFGLQSQVLEKEGLELLRLFFGGGGLVILHEAAAVRGLLLVHGRVLK